MSPSHEPWTQCLLVIRVKGHILAGWPGTARLRDTPGGLRPTDSSGVGALPRGVWPGSEVSRGHLLQDAIVQREVRDESFPSCILLFQPLQPVGLIHAQPAVFLLPARVGLLGEAELATRVDHGEPFTQLNFDGLRNCPMSSSAVSRFRASPLLSSAGTPHSRPDLG